MIKYGLKNLRRLLTISHCSRSTKEPNGREDAGCEIILLLKSSRPHCILSGPEQGIVSPWVRLLGASKCENKAHLSCSIKDGRECSDCLPGMQAEWHLCALLAYFWIERALRQSNETRRMSQSVAITGCVWF